MIVFVAGMQRSGSTFSFNIVRELLERRGATHIEDISNLAKILDQPHDVDHLVFKGHAADLLALQLVRLGAIKVVCTIRRPEDAIASWMETFGFELTESIGAMREWLLMFDQLRSHALIVAYEDIDHHPWLAAMNISKFILGCTPLREVLCIARRYSKSNVNKISIRLERKGAHIKDIGFTYYDKNTFFHRNHVSAVRSRKAADRIGEEAVTVVRSALKEWVNEDGSLRKP